MDPRENPFSPGAGAPPPELAGRADIIEKASIALARIKAGKSERSPLLVGLRGVGKTVLLNSIQQEAERQGFIAALIEAREDKSLPALLAPNLRRILFELDRSANVSSKVKRGLGILRSFMATAKLTKDGDLEFGLGIDPERGVADSGDLEVDLPDLLLAIGEAAKDRHTAIALIIDELQYIPEKEFGALIMAMHKVSQKGLPILVIGAGLPQLVGNAGRAKSYAERLFLFPQIGALDREASFKALQDPVRAQNVDFTSDALEEVYRTTKGYPYFLQEWGYQAWNLAQRPSITLEDVRTASEVAVTNLDQNFFRVRFDRLTPNEKRYLRAMAEGGGAAQRSGDIAALYGESVENAAGVRGALIEKGMIYSPQHGDTAFTVPLFDEFMRRTMPMGTRSHKQVKGKGRPS